MCPFCRKTKKWVIKKGFFKRLTGRSPRVQRFFCKACKNHFSTQTTAYTYGERKSHVNQRVFRLLCRGVSQRDIAHELALNPKTVARKMRRLSTRADDHNQRLLRNLSGKVTTVVFDEMETFEHSKCKPLSIAVAVEEGSRKVLFARVASMPAKGRLAAISRKRYGKRKDGRAAVLREVMRGVSGLRRGEDFVIKSDESPRYPLLVREILPGVTHSTYKGRRGCVVGQGELKAGGFDPLFSLNHTCAMKRDKIKRLTRRTWCTTKKPERLQHLATLFTHFHNSRLARRRARPRV